jgi:hypothetical protein
MRRNIALSATALAATLLMHTLAFAQADWTQRFPTHVPPKRMYPAMAQYGNGGAVVMFGGLNLGPPGVFTQFTVLRDTWVWNGTDWSQVTTSTTPPARYGAGMAYDPVSGKAVLFGGRDASGNFLADTWTFRSVCVSKSNCGLTWTRLSFTGTSPPGRADASMAYDPAVGYIVLTSGVNNGGLLNDTWDFNPATNTWRAGAPFAGFSAPGASRSDAGMAQCTPAPSSNGDMIFGGFDGSYTAPLGDAWVYDWGGDIDETDSGAWNASGWDGPFSATVENPAPPARFGHGMAFYPPSEGAVLYGGQAYAPLTGTLVTFTDTWTVFCPSFTTASPSWIKATPAHNPGSREFHGMSTGPGGFTVVLFGGDDLPFPRLASGSFPNGRDHSETWTWGRRVACLPVDGSQLSVGSGVTCQFDPAEGVQFGGWSANGFAPPFKDRVTTTFHTESPGPAAITAEWTDAEGSHSETFNYTIAQPNP